MPVVQAEPTISGPGWGCSCRAFRLGEPTPEEALSALARVVDPKRPVTVRFIKEDGNGIHFTAWSDPEERYNVTYDPGSPGGWCKHIVACAAHWFPWNRQLALGADEALGEIKKLRKELGSERKKRERIERKLNA